MQIYVNGDLTSIDPDSLVNVLASLGYECKKVVVAVNESFVAKTHWSTHELQENDRLEVLSPIQGG